MPHENMKLILINTMSIHANYKDIIINELMPQDYRSFLPSLDMSTHEMITMRESLCVKNVLEQLNINKNHRMTRSYWDLVTLI